MNHVPKPTAAQDSVWLDRLNQVLSSPASDPHKKSEPDKKVPRRLSRRTALAALVGGGAATAGVLATAGTASAAAAKVDDASAFTQLLVHEASHSKYLVQALGNNARPAPTFRNLEQPSFTQFALVSQILENTGTGAYLGAAPFISDRGVLAAAGSILAVEARHSGWLNNALGNPIDAGVYDLKQDRSFEDPLTPAQVAGVGDYFIASLNGGPAATYSQTPSAANDVAILNFALVLELLEYQFYLVNVPKFFGSGATR